MASTLPRRQGPWARQALAQQQRWRELGLADNPFVTLAQDQELCCLDHLAPWVRRIAPLASQGGFQVLQIQSPSGWGKSTLLRHWAEVLEDQGQPYCYQRAEPRPAWEFPPAAAWLLLDEAGALARGWLRRLRAWVVRSPQHRLVLTTHVDLSPVLPVDQHWRLKGLGVGELQAWYCWRLRRVGGDPKLLPLSPQTARWLLCWCAGNLHEILALLYLVFETASVDQLARIDPPLLAKYWPAIVKTR